MNLHENKWAKETILPPTTRIGSLKRWDNHGLGLVESTGILFGFTFDKIRNYRGESPKELGWRIGSPVIFTTCDGLTIKEISINRDLPD